MLKASQSSHMHILPAQPFATPNAALTWALEALALAATDGQDPWHQLAFAYTPLPNQRSPSLKTVVLRAVEGNIEARVEQATSFAFYTDTRSGKWAALNQNPTFQALFTCPQRWVQLSVRGHVTLESSGAEAAEGAEGAEMAALFTALSPSQQQAYTSALAPGAVLSSKQGPPLKQDAPNLGAQFFGRVVCHLETLDFVALHRAGHQRIGAEKRTGINTGVNTGVKGAYTAQWLLP